MDILVVGSVALDDIKTPFGEKKDVLGGAASHFSIAASVLAKPRIVGVVGEDFPKKYIKLFESKNIETDSIQFSSEGTFHWKGHYENSMDTAITNDTFLGAFASFAPKLTDAEKNSPFLFLANIDPDVQMQVLKQMNKPLFVGLDSMNFWLDSKVDALWKVIKKIDTLFLNDTEIRQLAGEYSLIKAAKIIQKKGPKNIVVKKGEYGAMLVTEDGIFQAVTYPTEKVKDPTGAGDSFAGGFVSYLAKKVLTNKRNPKPITFDLLKQAVIWGSATASVAVEGFSVDAMKKATSEEIKNRCKVIYDTIHFKKI